MQHRIQQQRVHYIIESYSLMGIPSPSSAITEVPDTKESDTKESDTKESDTKESNTEASNKTDSPPSGSTHSQQQADAFRAYVEDLLERYPQGLIEIALVETLVKGWLSFPMKRGLAFLSAVHERLKQWQASFDHTSTTAAVLPTLTPSQFSQITGLDAQLAFAALNEPALNALAPSETDNRPSSRSASATTVD